MTRRLVMSCFVFLFAFYSCNKENYVVEEFYDDGSLHKRTHFSKDSMEYGSWPIKHGLETIWYPNGNKEAVTNYHYGLLKGEFWKWKKKGMLVLYCFDVEARTRKKEIENNEIQVIHERTRKCFEYYENQSKKYYFEYLHAKKHGTWIEWNEEGEIMMQEEYKNGILFKTIK